ncbi:MAG: ferric reductase-like transmembrane domain-containing protein [Beijerinckiaceae bacterium]|nr:ferric reductase-like transmembrane domain-containing protein [Beijerinckiaceae bacterium]
MQKSARRAALVWAAVAVAIIVPIAAAASSELLAFRAPIYIVAGFAGIAGLALMLLQPLLAAGALPGIGPFAARRLHRAIGVLLVAAILLHVAGLWLTSPPDVIDALTFTSPTPFSAWGVIAMWALFATALLAALRRPLRLGWRSWRFGHTALACLIVCGTAIHALLIDGTMEPFSKAALCVAACAATLAAVFWKRRAAGV